MGKKALIPVLLFFAALCSGCGGRDQASGIVDQKAIKAGSFLLAAELRDSLLGRKSEISMRDAISFLALQGRLSSKVLASEYSANQSQTDAKYKGKNILLIGRVVSQEKNSQEPYLTLQASDLFFPTRAYTNKAKGSAISYKKGQIAYLICTVDGFSNKLVRVSNCDSISTYIAKKEVDIHKAAENVIARKKETVAPSIARFLLKVHALAPYLPAHSACFSDDLRNCRADLSAIKDEDYMKIKENVNKAVLLQAK